MSAQGYIIWVVALIGVMLVLVGNSLGSLMVTMETFDDKNICGNLNCRIKDSSEVRIFIITSLTLYNISRPEERFEIATVKNDGNGIKINQSKTSNVVGAGCINRYDADLSVSLINPNDCYFGKFLCELEYVDTDGNSDTIITHVKAKNACNDFNNGALSSQLSKLSRRLDNTTRQLNTLTHNYTVELVALRQNYTVKLGALRQNYTVELGALRQNYTVELGALRQNYTVELGALKQNYTVELVALEQQNFILNTQYQIVSEELTQLKDQQISLQTALDAIKTNEKSKQVSSTTHNCIRGIKSNITRVKFLLWGQIPAVCDTETDGGGWVLIQRRALGNVDFYRDWQSYKTGFGTPDTDFWLGNDVIHNLTSRGYSELRVDMIFNKKQLYAQYEVFAVDNENQNYRLTVSGYKGNATDSLTYHNNMMFSTYDRDNDKDSGNCATTRHGAWWYDSHIISNLKGERFYIDCYRSNMNGVWGVNNATGIMWRTLSTTTSLTFTEIKVRIMEI